MKLNVLARKNRDFRSVFSTEEGQRVLGYIYKMCGMNTQIHTPNDPHGTSFNSGKHRVGQGIQSILAMTEEDVAAIIKLSGSQLDGPAYDPYNQK
jgi:hypothetical protein